MSTSFRIVQHIAAPPDAVYGALTSAAALEQWLAEHADVALDDGRYAFWGRDVPGGGGPHQRLIEAEPDRGLRIAWERDGRDTEVEILLALDVAGTLLTLTQSDSPDWGGDLANVRHFWSHGLLALAEYAEGRPPVARYDFSHHHYDEARAEIEIEAAAQDVYAALVEPVKLERWMAAKARVEPRVGGAYDLGWDREPMKILELVPGRTLAHTWHNEGEADTVVRWELEGSGGRTHLTVVHSGFADGRPSDAHGVGWMGWLIELKRMHELGPDWQKQGWAEVTVA
jgi:uncharacterized protein YndB with AHSA1/START domain